MLAAVGLEGGKGREGSPPLPANSFIKGNPPIYPIRPPSPPPLRPPPSIILSLLFAPLPATSRRPSLPGLPRLHRRCRHAMGNEGRVGDQPTWSPPSLPLASQVILLLLLARFCPPKKTRPPLTTTPQPQPSLPTTTMTTTTPKPQRGDRRFPLFPPPQQQEGERPLAVSREFGQKLREQLRTEAAQMGSGGRKIRADSWQNPGAILGWAWLLALSLAPDPRWDGRQQLLLGRRIACGAAASLLPCLARRFGFGFGRGTDLSRPVQLTSRLCLHFRMK